MNNTNFEMLALLQSFVYSVLILGPIYLILQSVFRKHGPEVMQLSNLSDNIVRSLALFIFLLMIGSFVFITYNWSNWYGLIGPVEFSLLFLFIPLYKKME